MVKTVLVAFLIFGGSISSAETKAEVIYRELRDLNVLVRIPKEACKVDGDLTTVLRGSVQSRTSDLIAEFKELKLTRSETKRIAGLAKGCKDDCSCEPLSEALSAFKNVKELVAAGKAADKKSTSLTDKDFQRCQAKSPVNCGRKSIQEMLRQARESAL